MWSIHTFIFQLYFSVSLSLAFNKDTLHYLHSSCNRSLADAMDNVSEQDRWWELSKLYWTARTKMGDIPLTGIS
jgi:hypothetical protein